MKMDSHSQMRGASLFLLLLPCVVLLLIATSSTCQASPVASPAAAEGDVMTVDVEVEMESDTEIPKALAVNTFLLTSFCVSLSLSVAN